MREAFPGYLFLDVPPHIREQQRVDIDLGVQPLNSCPIGVKHLRVGHPNGRADGRASVQGCLCGTEDTPFVTD